MPTHAERFQRDYNAHDVVVLIDYDARNVDDVNAAVVRLAEEYGHALRPDAEEVMRAHDEGADVMADGMTVGEALTWLADDATDYLNTLVPDGLWVGFDGYAGAFGVWNVED